MSDAVSLSGSAGPNAPEEAVGSSRFDRRAIATWESEGGAVSEDATAAVGDVKETTIARPSPSRRALAPFLVFGSLTALAVLPLLIQFRITRLRAEITEVADPARDLVTDLQLRLAMEAVGARGFLITGQDRYASVYEESKRERMRAYAELLTFTRRLGPPSTTEVVALGRTLAESDSLFDGLVDGRLPAERYVDRLPERELAFTRAIALVARIDRAVNDATVAQRRAIRLTEWVGLVLTGALALLALAATGAVARIMAARRRAEEEREELYAAERAALARSEEARTVAEERRLELERVTESRAVLIRGFSHDVKNPLGAADGYLALFEDGVLGAITEQQEESLGRARRSIARALALIKNLIAMAQAETVQVERDAVDLKALVAEMVDDNRGLAAARNLALSAELPEEMPAVPTDGARVRQILGNLLSNAIKYTHRGGITVTVEVRDEEHRDREGLWAVIRVTDTGPGIAADQQRLLFREFHRLDTAGETDGMGIGLAISRRLARALGGDLTVDSEVGRGSTFALWLAVD
jgi:signal transduction histidine kinase